MGPPTKPRLAAAPPTPNISPATRERVTQAVRSGTTAAAVGLLGVRWTRAGTVGSRAQRLPGGWFDLSDAGSGSVSGHVTTVCPWEGQPVVPCAPDRREGRGVADPRPPAPARPAGPQTGPGGRSAPREPWAARAVPRPGALPVCGVRPRRPRRVPHGESEMQAQAVLTFGRLPSFYRIIQETVSAVNLQEKGAQGTSRCRHSPRSRKRRRGPRTAGRALGPPPGSAPARPLSGVLGALGTRGGRDARPPAAPLPALLLQACGFSSPDTGRHGYRGVQSLLPHRPAVRAMPGPPGAAGRGQGVQRRGGAPLWADGGCWGGARGEWAGGQLMEEWPPVRGPLLSFHSGAKTLQPGAPPVLGVHTCVCVHVCV